MTAIYCRQSVDKKDSISIEQQIEYCKARAFGEPCEVYSDKGYTGANTNRPDFERMMSDIAKNKISKVIVYKVDRISRSLQDFVNIYSEFRAHNVSFDSCSENFDTSTDMGNAILQIIMVFAELERKMIQKRVHDNFYERGKKGLFLAGVEPFGFRKVETEINGVNTHKLETLPEQVGIVRWIYNEYLNCKSLGKVVKQLNAKGITTNRGKAFSGTSVSRILRNPVYVRADADVYRYLQNKGAVMNQPIDLYTGVYGCTIYGERKSKTSRKFTTLEGEHVQMNAHEGIISPHTWLAVQRELDKNKPLSNSGKGTHTWLTGLTKCAFCGRGISVVNGQRNGKRYINCGGRKEKYCYARNTPITFDDIEALVEENLLAHLRSYEYTRVKRDEEFNGKQNELKIKLANTEREIQSFAEHIPLANEAVMKIINENIDRLENERIQTEAKLSEIAAAQLDDVSPEMIGKALSDWAGFDFSQKKAISGAFIEKVVIGNNDIDIVYKN